MKSIVRLFNRGERHADTKEVRPHPPWTHRQVRLTRREFFLVALLVAVAVAVHVTSVLRRRRIRDQAAEALMSQLGFMEHDRGEIERFLMAYEEGAGPLSVELASNQEFASIYLMSTDYFEYEDDGRPPRFRLLYGARINPCYNPLARMALAGVHGEGHE